MELKNYLLLVRRWAWLVLLCIVIAGGSAYYISQRQTPLYSARSTVILDSSSKSGPSSIAYAELVLNERLTRTYTELVSQSTVIDQVIGQLGYRPASLQVIATPREGTSIMDIRVQSNDAEAAAFIANHLPAVLSEQQRLRQAARFELTRTNLTNELQLAEQEITEIRSSLVELQQGEAENTVEIGSLTTRLAQREKTAETLRQNLFNLRLTEDQSTDILSVIEEATVPRSPVRPQPLSDALLAAVIGAMVALGIAFVVEYTDDTIKGNSDLEELFGLGILARVGKMTDTSRQSLVSAHDSRSIAAEAFRLLRTNIRFALVDEPLRTILVTSPAPSEGKSTTASNLATVMAMAGHSTILVDADLRRPRQHKVFEVSNRFGLTTALVERDTDVDSFIQTTSVEGLRLLSAGPIPPNPSELLGSHRMRDLLVQLQGMAEYIIIDTSPVLAVADSSLLAGAVSGVLLVVRANSTQVETTRRAVEQLSAVQARLLGAVVNDVSGEGQDYYYYYASDSDQKRKNTVGSKMRGLLLSLLPVKRG